MKLTLSLMRLSSKLAERLEKYGRYYPSPLTIQHIIEFGNYKPSAFIWQRLRAERLCTLNRRLWRSSPPKTYIAWLYKKCPGAMITLKNICWIFAEEPK